MKKIFITATDTDAGKTHVAAALIHKLVKQGKKVAALKPISAGCELIDGQLVNEDAKRLTEQANCGQSINEVNPIAFLEPIAPHIAAAKHDRVIELEDIHNALDHAQKLHPDILLTEGAGGWRLPLGKGQFLSDFAQASDQQVILIVNMKLGCLNHAILTYQAILADGLTCLGWIANSYQNMPYLDENIAELKQTIDAPLLGIVPFEPSIEKVAELLDVVILS